MSIINYPDGSNDSDPIVLTDNNTQLQVITGSATQSGVISESGGFYGPEKTGAGTLILTADNSYSGTTTISAGALQIGDDGTTGSLGSVGGASNIVDDATLIFDHSNNLNVRNQISGTGSVIQSGSGTTTILGSTFTGAVIVDAGTLSVFGGDAIAVLGGGNPVVINGGTLEFYPSTVTLGSLSGTGGTLQLNGAYLTFASNTDSSFGGVINDTASGQFTKGGTDTLTLTGNSTLLSQAAVSAGTLLVDGTFTPFRGITVASGATLGGNGTVSTTEIQAGGSLAPGDGIGTLTVDGNLGLAVGANYDLSASPTAADETIVSGTASIGGNLAVNFSAGAYAVGQTYTILDSTNSLSGAFANISETGLPSGLSATVSYDAHDAYLTIDNSSTAKASAAVDFNDDGKSDILLQNSDGRGAIWFMNGTTLVSGAGIGPNPGPDWRMVGTGDFNGDGQTDILLQNSEGQAAVWLMNGTTLTGGVGIAADPGPDWHMVGTGDFNSDGQTDILLQNNEGEAAIWQMNGTTVTDGIGISANPGPDWHIVGTGDFNGDGQTDILLQNTDGEAAIWLMNGANVVSGVGIAANPGPDWRMVGTGDFSGDGKTDILLQNSNGQAAVWEMSGTSLVSGAGISSNPGSSWHMVT